MKLISFFSRKVLNPFTRTNNRLDDIIYYSLESPVKFAIMLLGIWIAIHRLVSPDSFVKVIDNAYKILIILDITWIFAPDYPVVYCKSTGDDNRMDKTTK